MTLKQGTLLEQRLGQTARHKRPSRAQVRLAREFDADIIRFERAFRIDILKVLERLGREIEGIAEDVLETEPGKRHAHVSEAIKRMALAAKDAGQDAMAAALITENLNIAGFEVALAVVYTTHYRRILKATVSRINGSGIIGGGTATATGAAGGGAAISLGISISEPLEAEILAAGGRRVGLLDMSGKTRRKVFEQLSQGRGEGEAVAQLARRLRDFVPAGRFKSAKTRATLIARTETTSAQRVAAAASYKEGGVTEVLILDSRKGSFDEECDALNGVVVSLAEGEALMAEEHPNGTRRMVAMPPPIIEGVG